MNSQRVHPTLDNVMNAADALVSAAMQTAKKAAAKARRGSRRNGAYVALQPGPDTPLWNELADACASELKTYGEKARLARLLRIPRQRLHLLLVAKSACPDAERTLELLAWLQSRRRGSDVL